MSIQILSRKRQHTPAPGMYCGLFWVRRKARPFLVGWRNTCSSSNAVAARKWHPTQSPSAAGTGGGTGGRSWKDKHTIAPVTGVPNKVATRCIWHELQRHPDTNRKPHVCKQNPDGLVSYGFVSSNTSSVSYLNTMISSAESCLLLYCWRQMLQWSCRGWSPLVTAARRWARDQWRSWFNRLVVVSSKV